MKGDRSRCLSFLLFIAITLLGQAASPAPIDIFLTRQEDGTPLYSNVPRNKASQLIESTSVDRLHSPTTAIGKSLASHWNAVVRDVANRRGVDPALVRAVIDVESNFNPRARSGQGAVGLMQLMPQTATRYGVRDAFDGYQNIEAGVRHLKTLLDTYHGNVVLALAAYNAGEHTVIDHHGLIPPYRETMLYVPKVLARYEAYRAMNTEREGIR
ncbi:lytic transglycosylase domain-containing protein [Burkholderia sp. Ac-20353]|uniref:lytic transglycosylase domain-containing protein n=1 Tax=Burkholderia sp. Ac-20353 TaxID=2703894 RepID=UPI00197B3820|nr:lytic transglycosylase domain-containing protein [Burkholderia sp. Ac-20353]MBN3788942.1 lytic transglycosylase domain-containing protein [Burkholderia sp. Ac-20353]